MRVSIIVAWARGQVIGVDNQLPWHLPEDLRHFKLLTMGKPMIMGRKTYESIGRPLPGRTSIVVTRQEDWAAEGVVTCHSAEDALCRALDFLPADSDEVMVIGGADIYGQFLPKAEQIYLTEVDIDVEGDAEFPSMDWARWRVSDEEKGISEKSGLKYSFKKLVRS